jgi:hypothetical protein
MSNQDDLHQRYLAAAHAVQAGVQVELNDDPPSRSGSAASPKMLRTGINLAMVEHGALVRLLIAKGLITNEEYMTELVAGVEDEQRQYEERLSSRFGGTKIKLV